MKRKLSRISAAVLSALMILTVSGCGSSGGDAVAVQSVATIVGTGSVGLADRFAGVVVSGSTEEISLDTSMTLDEILVTAGQDVTAGDVLFTYDNEALLLTLEQSRLEIEGMKNTITANKAQIAELEKERNGVSNSEKLQYTLEIQTLEANNRETEYNIGVKEKELARQETLSADTEVKTKISGRVLTINKDGGTDNNGNPLPFITVMETGKLRIKGTINEVNRNSLTPGIQVVIRSRTDNTVTWSGAVDSIDWDNPIQSTDNYYSSSSSDDMTTSSKYPFYVTLENYDGLFMGQHVYIEPGISGETGATGLQLPSYFINDVDTEPWVWAASSKDKLEKRSLTLGEYNGDNDTYEIVSGLTEADYIAFPDDTLSAGAAVEKYDGELPDNTDNGGNEIEYGGDIAMPEEMPEESGDMPVADDGGAVTSESAAIGG